MRLAWAYTKYKPGPDIRAAESAARAEAAGLWSDPSPVPPWDWRHARKEGR